MTKRRPKCRHVFVLNPLSGKYVCVICGKEISVKELAKELKRWAKNGG